MNDEASSRSLVDAAFSGDLASVKRLVAVGLDPEEIAGVWNTLHAAIENEQDDVVRLLIEQGADIESERCGSTALFHAIDIAIDGHRQCGGEPGDERTDLIEMLLDHGANPESGVEIAKLDSTGRIPALLRKAKSRKMGTDDKDANSDGVGD